MSADLIEVYKAVQEINESMFGCFVEPPVEAKDFDDWSNAITYSKLYLLTDGETISISFLDIPIWDTDMDEREYDDEKDDWEPLVLFLKRKITGILSNIVRIKFNDNTSDSGSSASGTDTSVKA